MRIRLTISIAALAMFVASATPAMAQPKSVTPELEAALYLKVLSLDRANRGKKAAAAAQGKREDQAQCGECVLHQL